MQLFQTEMFCKGNLHTRSQRSNVEENKKVKYLNSYVAYILKWNYLGNNELNKTLFSPVYFFNVATRKN